MCLQVGPQIIIDGPEWPHSHGFCPVYPFNHIVVPICPRSYYAFRRRCERTSCVCRDRVVIMSARVAEISISEKGVKVCMRYGGGDQYTAGSRSHAATVRDARECCKNACFVGYILYVLLRTYTRRGEQCGIRGNKNKKLYNNNNTFVISGSWIRVSRYRDVLAKKFL